MPHHLYVENTRRLVAVALPASSVRVEPEDGPTRERWDVGDLGIEVLEGPSTGVAAALDRLPYSTVLLDLETPGGFVRVGGIGASASSDRDPRGALFDNTLNIRPTQFRSAQAIDRMFDATLAISLQGGDQAISIPAVARHANVGIKTAYRYFSSPTDVIRATVLARHTAKAAALRARMNAIDTGSDRDIALWLADWVVANLTPEPNLPVPFFKAIYRKYHRFAYDALWDMSADLLALYRRCTGAPDDDPHARSRFAAALAAVFAAAKMAVLHEPERFRDPAFKAFLGAPTMLAWRGQATVTDARRCLLYTARIANGSDGQALLADIEARRRDVGVDGRICHDGTCLVHAMTGSTEAVASFGRGIADDPRQTDVRVLFDAAVLEREEDAFGDAPFAEPVPLASGKDWVEAAMHVTPRQARARETANRLLTAGLAVALHGNMKEVGLGDIAAEAGVGPKSAYRYFASAADVFRTLAQGRQARHFAALRQRLARGGFMSNAALARCIVHWAIWKFGPEKSIPDAILRSFLRDYHDISLEAIWEVAADVCAARDGAAIDPVRRGWVALSLAGMLSAAKLAALYDPGWLTSRSFRSFAETMVVTALERIPSR